MRRNASSTTPHARRRAARVWAMVALSAIACRLDSGDAHAADAAFGTLRIMEAHATPTVPGSRTSAAYFAIQNNGKAEERLLGASSNVAGRVELHEMRMDGGMMRMRSVPSLRIQPGRTVSLGPGAYHLMLSDLATPLEVGEHIPLTLRFANAGSVELSIPVSR